MATRLMLASGAELLSEWPLDEAWRRVQVAGAQPTRDFMEIPLLVSEGALERSAYVRAGAIDALEPVGVVVSGTRRVRERAEPRPCAECGAQIGPGEAYVVGEPRHVQCAGGGDV